MAQMFLVSHEDFDVEAVREQQASQRGQKRAPDKSGDEQRKNNYAKHADVERRAEAPL